MTNLSISYLEKSPNLKSLLYDSILVQLNLQGPQFMANSPRQIFTHHVKPYKNYSIIHEKRAKLLS